MFKIFGNLSIFSQASEKTFCKYLEFGFVLEHNSCIILFTWIFCIFEDFLLACQFSDMKHLKKYFANILSLAMFGMLILAWPWLYDFSAFFKILSVFFPRSCGRCHTLLAVTFSKKGSHSAEWARIPRIPRGFHREWGGSVKYWIFWILVF